MVKNDKTTEIQPELIQNIYFGNARYHVLMAALELDLFTIIHKKLSTVDKIAKEAQIPIRPCRMILDALVGMGLINKSKNQYKIGIEASTFLVQGETKNLAPYFLSMKDRSATWDNLMPCLKSGQPMENKKKLQDKKKFFQDLVEKIFSINYLSAVTLSKKLGIGNKIKAARVLDLGCGAAAWSIPMAVSDPQVKVTAMDFPEILEVCEASVKRFRLQKQFDLMAADIMEANFGCETFDIIILGHICHMFSESEVRKLFKKAYDALNTGGKLIVGEYMVNELRTAPDMNLIFALVMLMHTEQGDVYSAKEYKRWLGFAGFKKTTNLNLLLPCSAMVATK